MFGTKNKFVFHCMNVKLVQEWLDTCDQYLQYVAKPFSSVSFGDLWKCDQDDWSAAYKEWSVVQFWMGFLVAMTLGITRFVDHKNIITTAINVGVRILVAFVLAHLAWFSVSKKKGCFCCLVACCECPPVLLLWGFVDMLWGVLGVVDALRDLDTSCKLCFLLPVFQGLYSVALVYMGLACWKMFVREGHQVLPDKMVARGPENERLTTSA